VNKPKPLNLTAQLNHRARGNPPNTLPHSAISNCFPGLEFDFRAIWRRIFVGIVIVENNNYVIKAEDPKYEKLVGHRLLRIDNQDVVVATSGPVIPGRGAVPLASGGGNPVAFMEWSNSIARVLRKQGQKVRCEFTKDPSTPEVLVPSDPAQLIAEDLEIRRIFQPSSVPGEHTAVLSEELIQPGELSQGLCSPWQNDYRECACYYWAASRPDYINVEPADDGASRGDNWMQRQRGGEYVLDNRSDSRLLNYDDLFTAWEKYLRFIIQGKDAPEETKRKVE
jgi:hypothetical protein